MVVSSEARVVDAVRFGFERAGAAVASLRMVDAMSARLSEEPGGARVGVSRAAWPELVVAGADTIEHAGSLLGGLRRALNGEQREVPILCLGPRDLTRDAALQAGASELLLAPTFVRDAVTLGQLMVTAARANRQHLVEGHLSDYGGVFYLARAMAAVGRTAVLSLMRGLRRGELRFHRGQITSAQVGMLHGMAALHQLLLWTRAHFTLRDEDVVPRRQIPLSTEDILADAERFLHETRSVMGILTPAEVYELVPEEIEGVTASIPAAVYRLVQLIDGFRTLADVIEESPYRVFETVRLANRLAELGWIRPARAVESGPTPLPGSLRRSGNMSVEHVLADEMSEVSGASIGTVELQSIPGSRKGTGAASVASGGVHGGAVSSDGVPVQPSPSRPAQDIDWSDVLPFEMSAGFSPVVPATEAAGEIVSRGGPEGDASVIPPVDAGQRDSGPATGERERSVARPAEVSGGERLSAGDPAGGSDLDLAQPPHVPPAPVKPRKSAAARLWKRLFGRGGASGDDDGKPRAAGKRSRKRRSRRRR